MGTFEWYSQTFKKVITILTKEDKRGRIVSLVDIAYVKENQFSLVDIACHISVDGHTKEVL